MSLNTQLDQRKVLLARPETTYGVDSIGPNLASTPSAYLTDAVLCSGLDLKQQVSVIERANYNPSISDDSIGVGKTLLQLTFKTELRASGVLATAPRIGRLLKACGFQETIIAAGASTQIGTLVGGAQNTSTAASTAVSTATKTTAPTKCFDTYTITAVLGGAAGTATYMVTGAGFPDLDPLVLPSTLHVANTNSVLGTVAVTGTLIAPVFTFAGTYVANDVIECFVGGLRFIYQVQTSDTVTLIAAAFKALMLADARLVGTNNVAGVLTIALSAATNSAPGAGSFVSSASTQAVTLGSSGAVVTLPAALPSVFVAGETIQIPLLRAGVRYDPVSSSFTSLTFYVYIDGALYPITGSRGTFTVDGTTGQYPMVNWTFTGVYVDPIDAALPTSLGYETSKAYKCELAALQVFGQANAIASKFSFDIGNTVTANENLNASEGYDEIRIVARKATAGCDPESAKPSVYNPWYRLRREDGTRFHVAVGIRGGTGNIIRLQADNAHYADVAFANRNQIMAFQYNFRLARVTSVGNDEAFLHFG